MEFKPKKEYVAKLLNDEGRKFIIPLYQRPYRWEIDKCETLWNDVQNAFNNGNGQEYFLGSIIVYETNNDNRFEVIDGQQRITTLTLLFRAFYECFQTENKQGDYPLEFGKCVWEYERDKGFKFNERHLISEVATDNDKNALEEILDKELDLKELRKDKSNYAKNYIYFYDKLLDFKQNHSMEWKDFCDFILGRKLFILFVSCDSQDSAMTIFNTLNSRGLPLSNADILKGYIYQNKAESQRKDFAEKWRELESSVENTNRIKDLDFLFLQYMHIIRAVYKDSDTTTPGILDFFTKKSSTKNKICYGANDGWLYKYDTIYFIVNLGDFWIHYESYLNEICCRYMSILNIFQNASWKSFVSSLVWKNRRYFEEKNFKDGDFDKENFSKDFELNLLKLIKIVTLPFLSGQASTNVIDKIIYKVNVSVLNDMDIDINHGYKVPNSDTFCDYFNSTDSRKAKYILFLDAYIYDNFLNDIESNNLEIEHILPKQWQNANFNDWNEGTHKEYLEQIGNKTLLKKSSNIKCLDNFFANKQKTYKDSNLKEVRELGNREKKTWDKIDIENRNKEIYERLKRFIDL